MKTLLQKGANPNLSDRNGWTPLKRTLRSTNVPGCKKRIKLLLEYKADPDGVDYHAEAAAGVISRSMESLFEKHSRKRQRIKQKTD